VTIALAILSVLGTLGGTALGAWLHARTATALEERRTHAEALRRASEIRAAARLVSTALSAGALAAASDAKRRSTAGLGTLSTDAWSKYQAILAAELPDDVYGDVSDACTKLDWTLTLADAIDAHDDDDLPDDDELFEMLQLMERICRQAEDSLAPFAYPEREP
jgi:hypothetical protein